MKDKGQKAAALRESLPRSRRPAPLLLDQVVPVRGAGLLRPSSVFLRPRCHEAGEFSVHALKGLVRSACQAWTGEYFNAFSHSKKSTELKMVGSLTH